MRVSLMLRLLFAASCVMAWCYRYKAAPRQCCWPDSLSRRKLVCWWREHVTGRKGGINSLQPIKHTGKYMTEKWGGREEIMVCSEVLGFTATREKKAEKEDAIWWGKTFCFKFPPFDASSSVPLLLWNASVKSVILYSTAHTAGLTQDGRRWEKPEPENSTDQHKQTFRLVYKTFGLEIFHSVVEVWFWPLRRGSTIPHLTQTAHKTQKHICIRLTQLW